ncbi:secondary thiamine-phosphate synthase enzyme YjbQ [Halomarina litorea]|uniref:secondary thiamine-phosphate synthase enzyme YjbQ n=1 Tax=Halomarina litorea TaxID=2961595 RepID=UPI0020C38E2E|nr:secondary thiamine-phosphate synthase enzyme YjbQ [Halomarina sp. BCD28]
MTAEFTVSTDRRVRVVDVTDRVAATLPDGYDGLATVFVRHTTAGITLNEAESRLVGDIERFVSGLAPEGEWDHDELDSNADAHLRSMLLGRDVTVPVSDGRPDLGTWQSVLLVECDGPRERRVSVHPHASRE